MSLSKPKKILAAAVGTLAVAAGVTVGVLYATGVLKFAKPAESTSGAYLFCYFVGNEPEQERIHFAVSTDGYNFEPLNQNEPVIFQTLGKQSVRDPYILRGEDGYFYIITYDRSQKMEQIRKNPQVAISGDWFTCHGLAESLGWFRKEENREIAAKLWEAFSSWIENGHNDFDDENTIILRVKVTDRVLYSQGRRFEQ